MTTPKDDAASDFPKLAQPAIRALHGAGLTRLEHLTRMTEADLSRLHGMGPRAVDVLRNALRERGLAFREPD